MAKVKRGKKEEAVQSAEESMVLTNSELLLVETSPLQVENARLLCAVEEQSLANMIAEKKLLEMAIDKQKERVAQLHAKYESEKRRHGGIIGEIMKNHNITSDKFSYNNETGEIIL